MNFQINIFVYLAVIAIVGFQLYRMGKSVGWENSKIMAEEIQLLKDRMDALELINKKFR